MRSNCSPLGEPTVVETGSDHAVEVGVALVVAECVVVAVTADATPESFMTGYSGRAAPYTGDTLAKPSMT